MDDLNKNNLKVGDIILVEQAWEDESGNHLDESAEIIAIKENGELELNFLQAPEKVKKFLEGALFMANDYERAYNPNGGTPKMLVVGKRSGKHKEYLEKLASDSFALGEKAMAKEVLRRIVLGKKHKERPKQTLGHIDILCKAVGSAIEET
jgi:hypothetical protein